MRAGFIWKALNTRHIIVNESPDSALCFNHPYCKSAITVENAENRMYNKGKFHRPGTARPPRAGAFHHV
jgi:hypothetical protein